MAVSLTNDMPTKFSTSPKKKTSTDSDINAHITNFKRTTHVLGSQTFE